jgi:hypothetical protein
VADQTSRQKYTEVTTCAPELTCSRNSAEWIIERPTSGDELDALGDWGTMNLSGDKAADSTVTRGTGPKAVYRRISAFPHIAVDMTDGERNLASVSELNRTGTAFSDTWEATR